MTRMALEYNVDSDTHMIQSAFNNPALQAREFYNVDNPLTSDATNSGHSASTSQDNQY